MIYDPSKDRAMYVCVRECVRESVCVYVYGDACERLCVREPFLVLGNKRAGISYNNMSPHQHANFM